jgi:hypothetical protein
LGFPSLSASLEHLLIAVALLKRKWFFDENELEIQTFSTFCEFQNPE